MRFVVASLSPMMSASATEGSAACCPSGGQTGRTGGRKGGRTGGREDGKEGTGWARAALCFMFLLGNRGVGLSQRVPLRIVPCVVFSVATFAYGYLYCLCLHFVLEFFVIAICIICVFAFCA